MTSFKAAASSLFLMLPRVRKTFVTRRGSRMLTADLTRVRLCWISACTVVGIGSAGLSFATSTLDASEDTISVSAAMLLCDVLRVELPVKQVVNGSAMTRHACLQPQQASQTRQASLTTKDVVFKKDGYQYSGDGLDTYFAVSMYCISVGGAVYTSDKMEDTWQDNRAYMKKHC